MSQVKKFNFYGEHAKDLAIQFCNAVLNSDECYITIIKHAYMVSDDDYSVIVGENNGEE